MNTLFVIHHAGTIAITVGEIFQITEWTFQSPLAFPHTFLVMSTKGVAGYLGLAERAFDVIFVFMVRLVHVLQKILGQFTPVIKKYSIRVL